MLNEPGAWAEDFSYGYLERLYTEIGRRFVIRQLGHGAPPSGDPYAFIRHDVDVSLERAVALARKEAEWGIQSTYHVMLDSPLYNIGFPESRAALRELAALGHEIGLHVDASRGTDIDDACAELEGAIGNAVASISFHRPRPQDFGGPAYIAGRVNAYGHHLTRWYLSDSRGRFREGDPIASICKPRTDDLQILIHPMWWSEQHAHPALRLRSWAHQVSATSQDYARTAALLSAHVDYDITERETQPEINA